MFLIFAFQCFLSTVVFAENICYYVDGVNGSDANNGQSPAAAVKTIGRARDLVRSADMTSSDVYVYIMSGDYFLDSAIIFNTSDSGRNGHTIHYTGYPGDEAPRIIGGQQVTGWTADAQPGVYKTNVGSLRFNRMYINGEPAEMARWPKKTPERGKWEFLRTSPGEYSNNEWWYKFGYNPADIAGFNTADWVSQGAQVYILPNTHEDYGPNLDWLPESYTIVAPITAIDAQAITIKDDALDAGNRSWLTLGGGAPYFIQGAREFLTDENEFFLNKSNGDLYYKPESGADINSLEIIAPRTQAIFQVISVDNISFEGLQLEATDRFDVISPWQQDPYILLGAVTIHSGSGNITIDGCNIYNTGGNAVLFHWGGNTTDCTIVNNHIRNIGHTAINLMYGGNRDILIDNNLIENIGQTSGYTYALTNCGNSYVSFTHNKVTGCSGVGTFMFDNYSGTANNNYIGYNEFTDCIRIGHDTGVIYSYKVSGADNIIEYNYVHDCGNILGPSNQTLHALYLDDLSDNFIARYNIFANMISRDQMYSIFVKGNNNQVYNNIVYQSERSLTGGGEDYKYSGVTSFDLDYVRPPDVPSVPEGSGVISNNELTRNIYYLPEAKYFYTLWGWRYDWKSDPPKFSVSDYNLFYFPGGYNGYNVFYSYGGDVSIPFTIWQGPDWNYDKNSITGQNPLFVDPKNGDFTVTNQAVLAALGFENIDQSEIGLYGGWPKQLILTSKDSGITISNAFKIAKNDTVKVNGDISNTSGKKVFVYLAKYKDGKLIGIDVDILNNGGFSVQLPKCQTGEKMKLMIWTEGFKPVTDYMII